MNSSLTIKSIYIIIILIVLVFLFYTSLLSLKLTICNVVLFAYFLSIFEQSNINLYYTLYILEEMY